MSEGTEYLRAIADRKVRGIPSLCSANEMVLRAALEYAWDSDEYVLIECTANQVNPYGGYTGMTPAMFQKHVSVLAREVGLKPGRLILGGDHLGPVVFKHLGEAEAMEKAREMIAAYVSAGFEKIHIDTSMRLKSDSLHEPLTDAVIARRGAALCRTAEETARTCKAGDVVYVIGSEVPVPGGAQAQDEEMKVTSPQDFENMLCAFQSAFAEAGIKDALKRVIAVVVQPGVEFGDDTVCDYDSVSAKALMEQLQHHVGIVFEGHSTDYQFPEALSAMVRDGVGILKVGPELTFALREGLFALQYINSHLGGNIDFIETLDSIMLSKPHIWQHYYTGTPADIALKRKFSYSDRWRYYAAEKQVVDAARALCIGLNDRVVPLTLLHQFLPEQYMKIRRTNLKNDAAEIVKDKVKAVLHKYYSAVAESSAI